MAEDKPTTASYQLAVELLENVSKQLAELTERVDALQDWSETWEDKLDTDFERIEAALRAERRVWSSLRDEMWAHADDRGKHPNA